MKSHYIFGKSPNYEQNLHNNYAVTIADICFSDSMEMDKDPGKLLRAQPMMTSHFPKIENDKMFLHINTFEDFAKLVSAYEYKNATFEIYIGMHVFAEFDNNKNDLQKFIKDLENLNCNYSISFLQGWDLYADLELATGVKRSAYYKDCLENVPPEKINFYLCNIEILEELKSLMPNVTCRYYSIYPGRINENIINRCHPTFFNSNNKKPRTRKTMCLNNANKQHRVQTVGELMLHDYRFSYVTLRGSELFLENETKINVSLDVITTGLQDVVPRRYVTDTYTYISTETYFYESGDYNIPTTRGWWSEKTWKAIYYELPFLVVGGPFILSGLQKLGFKTFPDLFDESYDAIEDPTERWNIIKNNIDKLMKMSYDDLHAYYYSDSTQEKLRHNKQLYLDLPQQPQNFPII